MTVEVAPRHQGMEQPRTVVTLLFGGAGRGIVGRLVARPWLATLGMSVMVTAVSSCSTTTVSRVKGPDNYTQKGVRYYASAPYIFASAPVPLKSFEDLYTLDRGANTLTLVGVCPAPKCSEVPSSGNSGGMPPPPPPKTRSTDGDDNTAGRMALQELVRKEGAAKGKGGSGGGSGSGEEDRASGHGTGGSPTSGKSAQESLASAQDPASPSSTKGAANISIVWLPDYCEQYSVEISNVLSTASLKLKLNNGWQFDNIDVNNDSTTVISKVLDTLASLSGASPLKSKPAGAQTGVAAQGLGAQGTQALLIRHSVVEMLQPGVYPLFERKGCDAQPVFNPQAFSTLKTETWELVPQPQGTQN